LEVNGILNNRDGGTIFGRGVVQITGTSDWINNGRILASGGTLTLESTSTASFDWDGSGNGSALLEASVDSTLIIDMPNDSDDYNGEIRIGRNAEMQNNFAWDLDGGSGVVPGIINLNGGTGTATISGAAWRLSPGGSFAELNASTGTGVIESDFTMINGTVTVAATATLQFDGTVTANAGTIVNNNLVVFNDDATIGAGVDFQMLGDTASLTVGVGANVIINDADFNFDGGGFASNVTNNLQVIRGAVTVNTNPSTIETPMTEFRWPATVTLNDDLSLDGDSTVEAGATFAGGGVQHAQPPRRSGRRRARPERGNARPRRVARADNRARFRADRHRHLESGDHGDRTE